MKNKKIQILIVDDDPGNIAILENILNKFYEIVTASNGARCLDIVNSITQPDLIILDIIMPELDGYEVCRQLQAKQRSRHIPVIFISALDSVESQSKGLALGAVDYLTKPFNADIVKARTKTHLKIKKQRDLLLQKQQELNRVNQNNALILNTAAEGIYGIDKNGRITFINPAALKMIGWREDEVIGKDSCKIMHDNKIFYEKKPNRECLIKQTIKQGQRAQNNDFLFWRKDGTSFPVEYAAASAKQNGTLIDVVIIFRDITERRQMEAELLRVDKVQAFEVLAGGIAHDFNNILAVTLGFLELAKAGVQPGEKIYKYLDEAARSSMQARELSSKFLTISQCYLSEQETTHLTEAISQVIATVEAPDNIKFQVNIPEQTWSLQASQLHFTQLLKNILCNAMEAMPNGGSIQVAVYNCPDGSIEHSGLNAAAYLKITVRDHGRGISPENLSKIFDPYFSTKPKGVQRGMGLGLTICQAIVKSHQGHMEIQSVPGHGTTVHIYLPVGKNSLD